MKQAVILLCVALPGIAGCYEDSLQTESANQPPDGSAGGQNKKIRIYEDTVGPVTAHFDTPELRRTVTISLVLKVEGPEGSREYGKQGYGKQYRKTGWYNKAMHHWLLLYLADRKLEDFRGAENLQKMAERIRKGFNQTLGSKSQMKILRVFFQQVSLSDPVSVQRD